MGAMMTLNVVCLLVMIQAVHSTYYSLGDPNAKDSQCIVIIGSTLRWEKCWTKVPNRFKHRIKAVQKVSIGPSGQLFQDISYGWCIEGKEMGKAFAEMEACVENKKSQQWTYNNKQFKNKKTGLCLTAIISQDDPQQQWTAFED